MRERSQISMQLEILIGNMHLLVIKVVKNKTAHTKKEKENKHLKRCLTSLAIREIQNKITRRYHRTLIRTIIYIFLKKLVTGPSAGKDAEKLDHALCC